MSPAGRRLLLLRHAKAVTASPGTSEASDHARALSGRGRADAVAMGNLMRERAVIPQRALVSSSLRTRETFALLGELPGPPEMVPSDALYLAEPMSLIEILREQDALQDIMLVGHNPGMHELAMMLAPRSKLLEPGFPTCMLALFGVEGAWSEIGPGRAPLLELLRP